MTKTPHLSDLHRVLLSHAAGRHDGSLLPVPEKFAGEVARIGRTIPALLKRQWVEEHPVTDHSRAWRDEDQQPVGVFITDAGRALIATDDPGASDTRQDGRRPRRMARMPNTDMDLTAPPTTAPADATKAAAALAAPVSGTSSKIAAVVALLTREEGATIAELTGATGWLPHTTRAALTGLRKKGHTVERAKRGDVTCYRIVAAA